jgi:hypothetical protein
MIFYLLTFAVILIVWKIKDYFGDDMYKDYSDNSVPLIKVAFKLALSTPGK